MVLAPVAQAAVQQRDTDIREKSDGHVNVKTSPLLILFDSHVSPFSVGLLPLRRDWLRKDVTSGQKKFAALKLRIGWTG
jgi:hypothetical protein